MRQFTSCVWIALLSGVLAIPTEPDHAKWESFKALHGKNHPPHEEPIRKQLFLETTAHIDAHNELYEKGLVSFSLRASQYSDLPPEEFVTAGLGVVNPKKIFDIPVRHNPANPILPKNFDWRDSEIMTPVRNQGHCGSCYAFATTAALEAHVKWRTNKTYDFSEQELLDCSFKQFGDLNMGCDGGYIDGALKQIERHGVASEDQYPYYSVNGAFRAYCRYFKPVLSPKDKNFRWRRIHPATETAIADLLVNHGPLVVTIAADREYRQYFKHLAGGIFDLPYTADKAPNHAVVLVGFGTENGKDYWIIKNSWGERWGIGGYGKIRRGVNMCNILTGGVHVIEIEK